MPTIHPTYRERRKLYLCLRLMNNEEMRMWKRKFGCTQSDFLNKAQLYAPQRLQTLTGLMLVKNLRLKECGAN